MTYIEKLKSKVSKEQLFDLYVNQLLSKEKCVKLLGISDTGLNNLLKEYQITRDAKAVKSKSNSQAKQRYFEQVKIQVSRDVLFDYYIVKNHKYEECLSTFNIKGWTLDRLLKEYNIHKDKKVSAQIGLKTKYENAGSWNYETSQKTLQEKYSVDNAYKLATHYQTNSKVNQKFADLLELNNIDYQREVRYDNFRYDFQVGDNTLIEINPWPFHNTSWCPIPEASLIDKNYHKQKSENAKKFNLRCIHVFEWDNYENIIKLLAPRETYYARMCEVKIVSQEEAKTFILETHIQGYAKDSIRLGLYKDSKLVSIMTFGKPRYNKNYEYELVRYCSCCNVIGGAQKLFKFFVTNYCPQSVVSYCDLSKFSGETYDKLGFKLLAKSQPAKHWFNINSHQHITDNLLRQRGFDQLLGKQYGVFGKGTSNSELMLQHGFVEIYDCGQATYAWTNQSQTLTE